MFFLISWFFYLFLLCSISLLAKYDFILRYEAWVHAIRASSFIENFPQINAKPISEISSGSSHKIGPSLYQSFFSEIGLENSREILAKSAVFSANSSLKIPQNLTFFSTTYQKPCKGALCLLWYTRYIFDRQWTLVYLSGILEFCQDLWFQVDYPVAVLC